MVHETLRRGLCTTAHTWHLVYVPLRGLPVACQAPRHALMCRLHTAQHKVHNSCCGQRYAPPAPGSSNITHKHGRNTHPYSTGCQQRAPHCLFGLQAPRNHTRAASLQWAGSSTASGQQQAITHTVLHSCYSAWQPHPPHSP